MDFSTKIYYGPNLYSKEPIVLLKINNIGVHQDQIIPTCKIMESKFPNIFSKKINKTIKPIVYFSEFLSLFTFNFINKNGGFLSTYGSKVSNNRIEIWIEFNDEKVTLKALETTINIFLFISNNASNEKIQMKIEEYKNTVIKYEDFSLSIFKISKKLKIPSFNYIDNLSYRQYGWGSKSKVFKNFSNINDSYHGVSISMNKVHSKRLLQNQGFPVAKDVVISSKNQLKEAAKIIGYPCVVKPIRGTQGIGISTEIENFEELQKAYDYAKESSFGNNLIMIEKFIKGYDHRITIINKKLEYVGKKIPPYIIGDGKLNIKQLIDKENKRRASKDYLKQLKLDERLISYLKKQNLSLEHIIDENQQIFLSNISNTNAGGTFEIVTEKIHSQIKNMCEMIADITQIDILGIDYITQDISKSPTEIEGVICEYNHTPTLVFREDMVGHKEIFNNIGRIPTCIIITINTNILNIKNKLLENNIKDKNLGWICQNDAYIGELPLFIYKTTAWSIVNLLFRQKTLDKAIIVCSIEEIIEKGLPLDQTDIVYLDDINIPIKWNKVISSVSKKIKKFKNTDEQFDKIVQFSDI